MKLKIEATTLRGLLTHIGIAILILIVIAFVFFFMVLPGITNQNKIVTVPDLNGMSLDEAVTLVRDKALNVEVSDSSYNASLPPLAILEQYPLSLSKVKIHRTITVKLNARVPPMISYPELSDVKIEFARDQLSGLNLKVGKIIYRPDIAVNMVLESYFKGNMIKAGVAIPAGSTVDLVVGTHPDEWDQMDDLEGMSLDDAKVNILGKNLKIGDIRFVTDQVGEENTVVKQLPSAGDTVQRGDVVELWIIKKNL